MGEAVNLCACIDANDMLAPGQPPPVEAARAAQSLKPGEAVLLEVSFRPAPLIDRFVAQGYAVAARQQGDRWQVHLGPKQ